MIDVKEVRLGNWFHHNEGWCYRHDELKEFNFQFEERDWYALGECTLFLENVSPIELTPELLVNSCGFKKEDVPNDWYSLRPDSDSQLLLVFKPEGEPFHYIDGAFSPEIKYVHQLQNLYYALTNTELEIKF